MAEHVTTLLEVSRAHVKRDTRVNSVIKVLPTYFKILGVKYRTVFRLLNEERKSSGYNCVYKSSIESILSGFTLPARMVLPYMGKDMCCTKEYGFFSRFA